MVGKVSQAHQGQIALHDRLALLRRHATRGQAQAEFDIAAHRQPGEDAIFLEDHAAVLAGAGDCLAVEQDATLAGQHEATEQIHQGRLAATRGADDRDKFALGDLQIDAVDHPHLAAGGGEVDADAFEADARGGQGAAHASRSCQATRRWLAARSSMSISKAIRPMQMMPT